MLEPANETVNIYEELRAQRVELRALRRGDPHDDVADAALDSGWLRAGLALGAVWIVCLLAPPAANGRLFGWRAVVIVARDGMPIAVVTCFALWTGVVAEASGRSRATYTLWALLTPVFTTVVVLSTRGRLTSSTSPRVDTTPRARGGRVGVDVPPLPCDRGAPSILDPARWSAPASPRRLRREAWPVRPTRLTTGGRALRTCGMPAVAAYRGDVRRRARSRG